MKEDSYKVIIFQVGLEEFAVPIQYVVSIERMQEGTSLPDMPLYVKGVIELRGAIIPIVDLREALNNKVPQNDDQTRIIVVRVDQFEAGFIVDSATDVIDLPEKSVQQPKAVLRGQASYLTGIAKIENRLIIILDTEKLLQNVTSLELFKDVKNHITKKGIAAS